MKLESFIKVSTSTKEDTEEIYDILKKKVSKEFINLLKKNKDWFTREKLYQMGSNMEEIQTRKNRKPVDTDIGTHNYFNQELEKRFGWKPRSEGVFVWNRQVREGEYFFPIGDFKYIYSPKMRDLYLVVSKLIRMFGKLDFYDSIEEITSDSRIKEEFDILVKTYKDTGIENVNDRIEVMFKCESYLLVNNRIDLDIQDLFNW